MTPPGVSTTERVVDVTEPANRHVVRRRRLLHRIVFGLLALLMLGAVLDGVDAFDVYGPDESTKTAAGAGYVLEVEHPSVTRPALAAVFRVRVAREGGFDEPIQLAISREYLESWDVNGILPAPAKETALGRWIIWEFDPPPGDELVVTYEARFEPGVQESRRGAVAVMVDDEPVAEAEFRTKVRF